MSFLEGQSGIFPQNFSYSFSVIDMSFSALPPPYTSSLERNPRMWAERNTQVI